MTTPTKPTKPAVDHLSLIVGTPEDVDPSSIPDRRTGKSGEEQRYFDGLVSTAKRDRATLYRAKDTDKARALANRLGRALGRCKLRDVFVAGATSDDKGPYAYIKPKPAKK